MNWSIRLERRLAMLRLRARSLFRRGRIEDELDREMAEHLEQLVAERVARGATPDAARQDARRVFGGVEQLKEESRDARGVNLLENLLRDVRFALRGLRHQPMLLLAATVSIGLGTAGNIAVFALARELLLAAPASREPGQLVSMRVSHGSHVSYPRWKDLDASGALEAIAGFSIEKQVNWFNGESAVPIVPLLVTANFFDVVGVPVERGRGFSTQEARAESAPHVALVTHEFWQRQLEGDSAVVGRSMLINGESYTVIGVVPPRLRSVVGLGLAPAIYLPLNRSLVPELESINVSLVQLVGRLKQGQTLSAGRAAVDAADRSLARLTGDTLMAGVQLFEPLNGLRDAPGKGMVVTGVIALLSLASLSVLLIACANVAGLLIARGRSRRRETAIRLAIGGSRRRLVQQFLVEGFLLALFGTVVGLGLSLGIMELANHLTLPIPLPLTLNLRPDLPVLLCAIGLVVLSTLLCALIPALQSTRLGLSPALKREEPRYGGSRLTMRRTLLIGQVTVSTVLLVTAALFVRSLARAQVTDPGFAVEHALVAEVGFVPDSLTPNHAGTLDRLVTRIGAMPDLEQVAYSADIPLTMHAGSSNGRTARIEEGEGQHVEYMESVVGPGFFATLRIPILQGREFSAADRIGTPNVAIINAEFARRYWGERSPVGGRLRLGEQNSEWDFRIVGVAGNGKYRTLGEDQQAALYLPMLQHPRRLSVGFVVARVRGNPSGMAVTVRRAIGELDRSVSVEVKPLRQAVAFALLPSQVGASILGGLGLLGVVLAAFGLYAIVAYNVSRSIGEIAIRMALGATSSRIVRLVIGDAALLVGVGLLLGLSIAALVTRPLALFLVAGLSATDPFSFAGTALAFLGVTILAAWLPARQAIRVSPAIAMRFD